MALKKCKECGNKVSTKANKCPNCGAPVKTTNFAAGCLSVIIVTVLVVWIASSFDGDKKNSHVKHNDPNDDSSPKITTRQEQIKSQFSAWDGSHRNLTKIIKKSMNDPKSYEHVETVYWDKGDHLLVQTTFRGKNAFGGVVKNTVTAQIDLNGNVVNVISNGL